VVGGIHPEQRISRIEAGQKTRGPQPSPSDLTRGATGEGWSRTRQAQAPRAKSLGNLSDEARARAFVQWGESDEHDESWLGSARRHVSVCRDRQGRVATVDVGRHRWSRGGSRRGAQCFFFWLGGSRSPSPRERRGARATANDQADSRAPTRSVVVCIVGRRPTGNEACEHRSRETAPRPYPIAVDSRHPLASSRRARPVQSCFSFRERFGNGCTAHGRAGPRSIGCAVATAPFLPP
jgi:hypothetical protein